MFFWPATLMWIVQSQLHRSVHQKMKGTCSKNTLRAKLQVSSESVWIKTRDETAHVEPGLGRKNPSPRLKGCLSSLGEVLQRERVCLCFYFPQSCAGRCRACSHCGSAPHPTNSCAGPKELGLSSAPEGKLLEALEPKEAVCQGQPGSSASTGPGPARQLCIHRYRPGASSTHSNWTRRNVDIIHLAHTLLKTIQINCFILQLVILKVKSTADSTLLPSKMTRAFLVYLIPFPSSFSRETAAAVLLLPSESARQPSCISPEGVSCFCWGWKGKRTPQEQNVQVL